MNSWCTFLRDLMNIRPPNSLPYIYPGVYGFVNLFFFILSFTLNSVPFTFFSVEFFVLMLIFFVWGGARGYYHLGSFLVLCRAFPIWLWFPRLSPEFLQFIPSMSHRSLLSLLSWIHLSGSSTFWVDLVPTLNIIIPCTQVSHWLKSFTFWTGPSRVIDLCEHLHGISSYCLRFPGKVG